MDVKSRTQCVVVEINDRDSCHETKCCFDDRDYGFKTVKCFAASGQFHKVSNMFRSLNQVLMGSRVPYQLAGLYQNPGGNSRAGSKEPESKPGDLFVGRPECGSFGDARTPN